MSLEPKNIQEFEAYVRGDMQPRPKILIHPETLEYYRLVPADPNTISYGSLKSGSMVRDAYYVPISIAPINIDFYTIGKDAMASASSNVKMPEGCHIESYRLHPEHLKDGESLISRNQLYTILQAIGTDSYWWPLEDPNYDLEEVFGDARVNVLFRDNKPLGAIIWDDNEMVSKSTATWIMVGVRPEERANKYGSFLIRWQMDYMVNNGVNNLNFYTGDTDFVMTPTGKIPAYLYYEQLGAKKIGTAIWDHKAVDKDLHPLLAIDHSMLDIEPDYFQHPVARQTLGRFSESELGRRLDNAYNVGKKGPPSAA
ncbi:MAG: GNAT family N-acetyltransferase [Rickettsiales bacterium]